MKKAIALECFLIFVPCVFAFAQNSQVIVARRRTASVASLTPTVNTVVQTGTDNAYNTGAVTGEVNPSLIVNLVTPFQGGANDCGLIFISANSGYSISSVTDNQSESWSSIASVGSVYLYGVHGTTAGTNKITVATSGTGSTTFGTQLGATVYELDNCSGFGGHGTLNTAATGSALTLTLGVAPASADTTVAFFWTNAALPITSTPLVTTITAGTGFTSRTNSKSYGKMSEYRTSSTSTSVQVTYSGTDTVQGAAVVVKAGPAGTGPPATKYVDTMMTEYYGLNTSSATHATYFNCTGNLIIGLGTSFSHAITAATSSGTTATWVVGESITTNFASSILYGYGASCSATGTITPTFTADTYTQIDYLSISNAVGTSGVFDTGSTASGNQTTNVNVAPKAFTPGGTGELFCGVGAIDFHTISGTVADGNSHTSIGPTAVNTLADDASSGSNATPASSLESDDMRSCYLYTSGSSAITPTYTQTTSLYSNPPTGIELWSYAGAFFK